ncbi:MAG: hypothetical protein AAF702_16920 [Chloroflexota bacterium]
MISKNITKIVVAVALTLAVTLGSGVVADEIGFEITPSVSACSGGTTGGGC